MVVRCASRSTKAHTRYQAPALICTDCGSLIGRPVYACRCPIHSSKTIYRPAPTATIGLAVTHHHHAHHRSYTRDVWNINFKCRIFNSLSIYLNIQVNSESTQKLTFSCAFRSMLANVMNISSPISTLARHAKGRCSLAIEVLSIPSMVNLSGCFRPGAYPCHRHHRRIEYHGRAQRQIFPSIGPLARLPKVMSMRHPVLQPR